MPSNPTRMRKSPKACVVGLALLVTGMLYALRGPSEKAMSLKGEIARISAQLNEKKERRSTARKKLEGAKDELARVIESNREDAGIIELFNLNQPASLPFKNAEQPGNNTSFGDFK